ncbi:MAG TPA: hypothetical protein PKD34_02750, partial [Candidatus Doudnabacteria bacterium]|nr:hypothetical protein [Candidatus Doudnabacteria bacterium]
VIDATGKSIQQNFNWQVNYDTRTWRTSTNYSGTTAKIRFQFSNTNFMSKTAVEINGQTYTTDDNGIVTLPVGSGQSMTVRYGWETKTFTTPIINTPAPTPTPTPTPIPPCTGVCA